MIRAIFNLTAQSLNFCHFFLFSYFLFLSSDFLNFLLVLIIFSVRLHAASFHFHLFLLFLLLTMLWTLSSSCSIASFFLFHVTCPLLSHLILSYLFDISSSPPLTFLPSLLSFQVTGVPVGWDEDAERSLLDDSRIAPSVLSSKNGKAVHTKVNNYQKIYFYICSPSKSSFVSCNHFTPHNSQHHMSPYNTIQCHNTQH